MNPKFVDFFTAKGQEPGRRRIVQLNDRIVSLFDQGDLQGNRFLQPLVRYINPSLGNDGEFGMPCWHYLESHHKKFGTPGFIKEIKSMFRMDDKDINVQWDTNAKTITVNISEKKKYRLWDVDWITMTAKNNGYTLHIKGGRLVTLECELESLKMFANALEGSGCPSVKFIPRTIDDEMKRASKPNAKPIDLVSLFPGAEISMGDDGFPPQKSNPDYIAHNIKVKFKVTEGVIEYPMTFFTKR